MRPNTRDGTGLVTSLCPIGRVRVGHPQSSSKGRQHGPRQVKAARALRGREGGAVPCCAKDAFLRRPPPSGRLRGSVRPCSDRVQTSWVHRRVNCRPTTSRIAPVTEALLTPCRRLADSPRQLPPVALHAAVLAGGERGGAVVGARCGAVQGGSVSQRLVLTGAAFHRPHLAGARRRLRHPAIRVDGVPQGAEPRAPRRAARGESPRGGRPSRCVRVPSGWPTHTGASLCCAAQASFGELLGATTLTGSTDLVHRPWPGRGPRWLVRLVLVHSLLVGPFFVAGWIEHVAPDGAHWVDFPGHLYQIILTDMGVGCFGGSLLVVSDLAGRLTRQFTAVNITPPLSL